MLQPLLLLLLPSHRVKTCLWLCAGMNGGPAGNETLRSTGALDLRLDVRRTSDPAAITSRLCFPTDLFDAATVQRMAAHYVQLLHVIADSKASAAQVFEISMMDKEEPAAAVKQLPSMQCPDATAPLCLWQFFESTVTKSKGPGEHKVALSDDEGLEMTFEQLQTMSEELDIWMRQLGCGKGTRVMLVNSISVWAFVAVMAVIRNGAIIIPNDYKDPAKYRAVRSTLWLLCLPRRRNRHPSARHR